MVFIDCPEGTYVNKIKMQDKQYLFFKHCYDCTVTILDEHNLHLMQNEMPYQVVNKTTYSVINVSVAIELPKGEYFVFFDEKFRTRNSDNPLLQYGSIPFNSGTIQSPTLKIVSKVI